jgi:sugar lactone lactonase YvrE
MAFHPVRALVLVTLVASSAAAQGPFARVPEIRRSTAAGEHERATALADSLVAELPHHPNARFTRALALAAARSDSLAIRDLRVLQRWDARYLRFAMRDSAFARFRPAFGGSAAVDSLAALGDAVISRGEVFATLAERDLIVEGSTIHPFTGEFLVGSLHKRAILAVAADGSVHDFVARGAHGLHSVAGIHADSTRGLLWATSNRRFDDPADTVSAALFAFDLGTGEFKRRVNAPNPNAFLNDLTTTPDGAVYVTDSRGGDVLVLRPGAGEMERFDGFGRTMSPNGITVSQDGEHLFVSDMDAIRVAHLASRQSWALEVPDSIVVSGIDGLAYHDGALVAHHPLTFWRIARYPLDPSRRRIVGRQHLERNSPDARTSTTGEVGRDGWYYYIGNSQIDRMNQRTIDPASMEPIRLYRARATP